MGEISNWGNCVARTPMYALARNRRFCPAAPMKKAPTAVLDSLHHCWGPNWHKTTLKQIQLCLMLGTSTLADDLSCSVQPPSLVRVLVLRVQAYSHSYRTGACTRTVSRTVEYYVLSTVRVVGTAVGTAASAAALVWAAKML